MLPSSFTRDQFECLRTWRGQLFDKTDASHRKAYEELREAYDVTKHWAQALQRRLFPDSIGARVIRRPIGQWHRKFLGYNWARIYPRRDAPKGLAFTVGIDADKGFVVKIDLVDTNIEGSALRERYEQVRGPMRASPIVALMPAEKGIALGFQGVLDWSAWAIENFSIGYDEMAEQLGLNPVPNQAELFRRFQVSEAFRLRQPKWSLEVTRLFVRLVVAIHELGFDWWATKSTTSQLVFGSKGIHSEKGAMTGFLFLQSNRVSAKWDSFEGLEATGVRQELSEQLVQSVEALSKSGVTRKRGQSSRRDGYWPDEYGGEEIASQEHEQAISHEPLASGVHACNRIFYGPPGTGKTYMLQQLLQSDYVSVDGNKRYEFVTFHQSYGYEEFVEGLRPVILDDGQGAGGPDDVLSSKEVRYEIRKGVFLRLCERARADGQQRYAMVIDEINRGNISKIFGELITLIEVDKREGCKYEVSLTLPYSGKPFSVPSNVDVIGTMNTADRSLALVDTALRRRFEFIELAPDPAVLAGIEVWHENEPIMLDRLLSALNSRIEVLYDREHAIGQAYFTPLIIVDAEHRFRALADIFRTRIIPLLEEYFFDDWHKIRLVLGDNQKAEHAQFIQEVPGDSGVSGLFGTNHGLDDYALRPRYRLNQAAFDDQAAYVDIYFEPSRQ